jgi:hypothetical protein
MQSDSFFLFLSFFNVLNRFLVVRHIFYNMKDACASAVLEELLLVVYSEKTCKKKKSNVHSVHSSHSILSHSVNEESIQRLYLLFQETLLEALHLAENKAGEYSMRTPSMIRIIIMCRF